jgi:uncharacterized membrane protein
MQDLGTLPGESYSSASAIDAAGRVVGSSWHPGKNNGLPFSWTQAEGMTEFGPFPGHNVALSGADGVNLAGQVLLSKYNGTGYSSWLATPLMHTTLTSSPNPSLIGEAVTFTASVGSAVHGPPPDGEIITFMNGVNVLGTAPLEAGVATITVTLKVSRRIRAAYAGDANYAPSKSVPIEQVVEK